MDIAKLKQFNKNDIGLRPYQREYKDNVYDAWQESHSVMLQMPTGTGKTRTFVSVMDDIHQYGVEERRAYKILVLVHRKELVDQIYDELTLKYHKACGVIMSGEREHKKLPFQIASVQSLTHRLGKWEDKQFDFIIIDEAHHTTAQTYQQIIKTFPNARILGVTATPCRLNGEGFTGTFEKLILSFPVKWFIDNGYLSDCDYYSVPKHSFIQREIDNIKKFSNGDYAEQEMERVCDNDRIRAQVVETYQKYAIGKKGIVYCINKQHCKNLCEKFLSQGIITVALDCDTPPNMREEYIEEFKAGKIQIICNVNLFTEGFDCPDIEFVQLARPTKSLSLYLQQVGRALRTYEGKKKALILDNVGLYNRFGLPKARRNWKHHFEGKIETDIANGEEIEESKQEIQVNVSTKRTRHQNLEEGDEEVFLIQTSDEEDYIVERASEFWMLLNEIYNYIVNSIAIVFKENYSGLGLELYIKGDEQYQIYNVHISEETGEIVEILKTQKFEFRKETGISFQKVKRCALNYEELLEKIEEDIWSKLHEKAKNSYNYWDEQFKHLDFSYQEMKCILPILCKKEFNPVHVDEPVFEGHVSVKALLICAWNLFNTKKTGLNSFNFVHLGIIDFITGYNFKEYFESHCQIELHQQEQEHHE